VAAGVNPGPASRLLESLVAIPSVTGAEEDLVHAVHNRLSLGGWTCVSMPVSPGRRNLLAHRGSPVAVLSTHADTVPPFFGPRRAGGDLTGRGACDAKGSLAAMILALEDLAARGESAGAALLLVVGEERGSDGAIAANAHPLAREGRYLVGGEPTSNRFVGGSKGCLRVAVETRGRAGHSSITTEQGARSAVDPLLDVLVEIRALRFAGGRVFGETTANIGAIEAGSAPNVVAEHGRAEILFRTGIPVDAVLDAVRNACGDRAEITVPYRSEPIAFRVPRGVAGPAGAAEIVSFACDLPLLAAWGEPILIGPGSIADAHAADERVALSQVEDAVGIYRELLQGLLREGDAFLSAPAPG
jgi:acetylornithine deacetylase